MTINSRARVAARPRRWWGWRRATPASAQKKYDTGATDTEIKIGNIMPVQRSGLGLRRDRQDRAGLLQEDQIEGGINGRKINFITYDDGYTPAQDGRAGAQARRGGQGACLIFNTLGTPTNIRRSRNT